MNPPVVIPDSPKSNNWFVCPQIRPEAVTRLFLFPYASGGPAAFNKWSTELPESMETRIAHYPGRGSRHKEPPIKQISLLVERLSEIIQPLLDKPFVFFGHSLGGLVAFELARQLSQRNLPQPQILFISACGAPHIPDPQPAIHALPDAEFLKSLQQLKGVPSELSQQPDVMQLLLPILRADFQAIESYIYAPGESPLNCPIVAFGGLNDPRVSRERLEGWYLHTKSGFKSQYFPGDHFFVNTAREAVIACITAELTSAHAKN
jgi:medium-chain acyl-[acyl-carrier-protein] hydrolase